MRRNLSAVLCADVVGYTRLMGEDAEATLNTLRRLRAEILAPAVAAKRGRVVKSMGDGWIVLFNAISDAVECAMHVQDKLKIDGAMALRMGIHLGDVAEVDEDVFGDGVNVASRLQALAEPGALAISGPACALLDGTLRHAFESAGEHELKNVDDPVPIWVRGGDVTGVKAALETAGVSRLAFVPVTTQDTRAEVQELASALTGDIANFINLLRFVSGRVTETPDDDEYVCRATLRTSGDRVRLEARLMSPDNRQILSEKYPGDLTDVFDWQDETALGLSQLMLDRVMGDNVDSFADLDAEECTAEQLIARGTSLPSLTTDGPGYGRLVDLIDLATQKRPDWGYPYALGCLTISSSVSIGLGPHVAHKADKLPTWFSMADKLEPSYSPIRIFLAFVHLTKTGDREQTKKQVHTVLRNLPFDPEALYMAAWTCNFMDEAEAAKQYIRQLEATVLPYSVSRALDNLRTMSHVLSGEFEEAIVCAKRQLEDSPDYPPPWRFLAASYGDLGDIPSAQAALEQLRRVSDDESISSIRARAGYGDGGSPGIDRYMDGLRKAGMPE